MLAIYYLFAENNLSSRPAQRWLNPGYSDLDPF